MSDLLVNKIFLAVRYEGRRFEQKNMRLPADARLSTRGKPINGDRALYDREDGIELTWRVLRTVKKVDHALGTARAAAASLV